MSPITCPAFDTFKKPTSKLIGTFLVKLFTTVVSILTLILKFLIKALVVVNGNSISKVSNHVFKYSIPFTSLIL